MTVAESGKHDIRTRPATPSDAALIVRYVRALADFEKEPLESVLLDEAAVVQHGFGERPRFEAIIAEQHGQPVGMLLFTEIFSTWTARPGIWIEELFVDEQHRGDGVGQALMAAVGRIAVERGCGRIELAVLKWNPAKEFYSRHGFETLNEWETMRLDGEGIQQLADGVAS